VSYLNSSVSFDEILTSPVCYLLPCCTLWIPFLFPVKINFVAVDFDLTVRKHLEFFVRFDSS